MENNKDHKVDENAEQAKEAADFTHDVQQTEKLIDPGNEHHHDGVTENDEIGMGSKNDAGQDAKSSTENKPG